MYYEGGKTHSTYQNPTFIPVFVPQFSSPAVELAAYATCSNNAQCLLDYAVTGNAQIATTTLTTTEAVNSTSFLFGKLVYPANNLLGIFGKDI